MGLSDTIHRVIKHTNAKNESMNPTKVMMYSYQTMRGIAYMHSKGIAHMDIKPQNLLLDGKSHALRICDFGTAVRLCLNEKRANYVCSRYFRAPEIIFGSTCYNSSIDLWSAGCVISEMLLQQPLFTGMDGIDQLVQIMKVLGTPSLQDLKAMNPNYQEYEFKPQVAARPWALVLARPELHHTPSQHACDLVSQLVRYDPRSRLPPLQAMLHPYFDELRQEKSSPMHRQLFEFLPDELLWCTRAEKAKIVPDWMSVKQE